MIELFEQNIQSDNRQSSKGNQLKWVSDHIWYKADYTGYEGLAEYMVSNLLKYTDLRREEYVLYDTEEIHYSERIYLGCRSRNFLKPGWQMITLERLFQNHYNQGLNKSLYSIRNHENRLKFMVEQTERITGLREFGVYMSKLLTVDAFFKNEDRHTHNIAVLLDPDGEYHLCPIFDNGAALLSDTTMDYPLDIHMGNLIHKVKSKTFCPDFDEQLDIAEKLYGQHIRFQFEEKEITQLLELEPYYAVNVKERVKNLILEQRRKYQYLFQ